EAFGLHRTRRFFLQGRELAHRLSKGSAPIVCSLPGTSVVTWVGRPSTRNENGRKYKTRVIDCKHFRCASKKPPCTVAKRKHYAAKPSIRAVALTLLHRAQRRIRPRIGGSLMSKNATLTYE